LNASSPVMAPRPVSLPTPPKPKFNLWRAIVNILDTDHFPEGNEVVRARKPAITLYRLWPFAFLHLGCLGAIWTGVSPAAIVIMIALYWVRMFFVTSFKHRYFSHRTFSTSRFMQAFMAFCCLTCVQRGPLWWAANHRHHHRHSDKPTDLHSPIQQGFWWSHMAWMMSEHSLPTDYKAIPDLAKYPELLFLNRFDWLGSVFLIFAMLGLGTWLQAAYPQLGTSPAQMLVWGFFVSTCVLFHGTVTINSLCHVFGSQRYNTGDTSRNNFWLAFITMGEGWHNNHHFYQGSCRQGFYWWELDVNYYILKLMSFVGLIWNIHEPPAFVYDRSKQLAK
jgi:stearoyl-CoA desaturase (Delta-9 desaturase)